MKRVFVQPSPEPVRSWALIYTGTPWLVWISRLVAALRVAPDGVLGILGVSQKAAWILVGGGGEVGEAVAPTGILVTPAGVSPRLRRLTPIRQGLERPALCGAVANLRMPAAPEPLRLLPTGS